MVRGQLSLPSSFDSMKCFRIFTLIVKMQKVLYVTFRDGQATNKFYFETFFV